MKAIILGITALVAACGGSSRAAAPSFDGGPGGMQEGGDGKGSSNDGSRGDARSKDGSLADGARTTSDAEGDVGAMGHNFCPTAAVAPPALDASAGSSLAGDLAPNYPQCTSHISVVGSTVTGSGTTADGTSDHFYGEWGVAYDVTVEEGAALFQFVDNDQTGFAKDAGPGAANPTVNATSADTPNFEVFAYSFGTLTNNGTLRSYPAKANNTADNYHKTSTVVYIDSDSTHLTSVTNNGTIGDLDAKNDPHTGYSQENEVGLFVGPGTITNNVGATISGYNAVFTNGSGTLDNYGTIVASNDGALSGYKIVNHAGASLSTNTAGFAAAHSYADVDNYGYMLGNDYAILSEGAAVINDYGGPLVPGVTNFDGSPVYNGEISSLPRFVNKPNTNGPFGTSDAIMLDGTGTVVNLISQTISNTLYLPVIVGPMEGGFNGNFSSASANVKNTLNFVFDGIGSANADTLTNAISASKKSNASGTYYSGTVVLMGNTYQWEDFANVAYTGTP